MNLVMAAEEPVAGSGMLEFVKTIFGSITSNVSLTTVASVVAAIIAAGIVAIFAWKFARKGYAFVKNALSGKGGKI